MGERKQRCRSGPWDEGAGEVHKGHFHIAAGMVVRGGGRHSICQLSLHMSQRSTFSSSKGLRHTWHCVSSEGRLAGEEMRDGTGPGEARLRVGVWKSEIGVSR